jgi:hypothetical protein
LLITVSNSRHFASRPPRTMPHVCARLALPAFVGLGCYTPSQPAEIAPPVVLSWELLGGRVVTPLTATALTFRPAESVDFEDRGSPPPPAAVQLRHFDLLRMLNVALYFRAVTRWAAWRACRGRETARSPFLAPAPHAQPLV